MRKELAVPFGIGLAVILLAVGAVLYMQRGAHVELTGSVLKVRTLGLADNGSLAVVDFRFANPADYPFVVRSCTLIIEDASGKRQEGFSIPEIDIRRIFEYYPVLGKKFNDSLLLKDKIAAHSTEDRMISARFEIPLAELDGRKSLKVRIEDVDGPVSELVEIRK
jgi:hypothetical protein